jgi:CxxC-x17-CxxC domain-containing protein
MSYADKTLACRDCNAEFTFTANEQEFYAQKGFTNEPSRCPACRAQHKANNGGRRMSSGPREMHTALCSSCGQEAQVPFVPRGDKPVYCSNCFQNQRSDSSSRW